MIFVTTDGFHIDGISLSYAFCCLSHDLCYVSIQKAVKVFYWKYYVKVYLPRTMVAFLNCFT